VRTPKKGRHRRSAQEGLENKLKSKDPGLEFQTDVMIFKNIIAEKFSRNIGFFAQTTANFFKNLINTLVL
jgi:hypothetical protein